MEDQQYLVLDSPFPKKALQLGTLTRDYSNPTADFCFPEHLAGTQDQSISTDKNVEEIMTASPTEIGRGLRRRILSSYTSTDLSKTYQLQSVECQVYQLKNTSAWFEKLGTDEQTRAWLLERLKQRQDVYILIGYLTSRYPVIKSWGRKPTPGVRSEYTTGSGVRLSHQAVEEIIFAVSYRKIRLKRFDKIQKASLQREHQLAQTVG